MVNIALDMMGGDLGTDATVSGLLRYSANHDCSDIHFDLFGDKNDKRILAQDFSSTLYTIHDTGDKIISASEKPAKAIKNGRGTSMYEAISWVAQGNADAVVSSGNTGAYMALSKMLLGTIEGIDRPAIVSIIPNIVNNTVMLDLGANADCSAVKLLQFAMMGDAVSRTLLQIENPRIGLLNIGTERTKGTEILEEAYNLIEKSGELNFAGFVEGTDITKGTVDVVVTDGFTGNISLKTMEGTIRYIAHTVKAEFSSSLVSKIGYLFCRKAINKLKAAIDPRQHNGATLVGLKKISIKSHGNSDAIGFEHAISVAVKLAKTGFILNIEKMMDTIWKGTFSES